MGLGRGASRCLMALVKSDLAVDTEVAPPSLSLAVGRCWMQALRRVLLGDNPIRAVVGQAEIDQPPQIERCGSAM